MRPLVMENKMDPSSAGFSFVPTYHHCDVFVAFLMMETLLATKV